MDKDIKNTSTSNILVRIDKNIASNSEALAIDFQNNDELTSSILMYTAFQKRHNLFDFGVIDPADFAEKMGFDPKYLTSVHPAPAYFEGMTKEQISKAKREQDSHPDDPNYRIFDSRLENALYLLVSRNITFRRGGATFENSTNGSSMQKVTISSIRLLKNFSIIFKKSKRGKKKLYYEYELDPSFQHNMSLLYVTANLEDFIYLRKKSLHKLYLYVKNLRDNAIAIYLKDLKDNFTKKSNCEDRFVADFDLLCQIAGIGSSEPRDRKARLTKAFKEIKSFLLIDLVWEKRPGSKWAYLPVIIFNEISKQNKLVPLDKLNPIGEKVDIFTLNFMQQVINNYKENLGYHPGFGHERKYLEQAIMTFMKEQPRAQLEAWYMQAQLETFTNTSTKSHENFDVFYKNIGNVFVYQDIKDLLSVIFGARGRLPGRTFEELQEQYKNVTFIEAQMSDILRNQIKERGSELINIGGKYYECSKPKSR